MVEKISSKDILSLQRTISVTPKIKVKLNLVCYPRPFEFNYISTGREALCQIPLSNILAVERLTEHSFKMKNMFQIVQKERALYVQAANCVEEKEWVDLLTKICQTNKDRLKKYHPGAFRNGHWLW